MHSLLFALALSTASAQDNAPPPDPGAAPAEEEPPLAIPFGQEPVPLPQEGPLAIPGGRRGPSGPLSPEKLAALRQYEAERLVLRGETEVHSGPATVWGMGWGWGPRWHGPVTSVGVVTTPIYQSRTWGIYQGPQRLGVPQALEMAGDDRGTSLNLAIQRKRRAANAWYTVAGVGGAAVVASLFGQVSADSRNEFDSWYTVGIAGGATAIVGLVAGAGPAGEARRLERYPAMSLSPSEAREVVDGYNDRLRERLGLTPAEVWSIEQEGPR